MEESNEVEKGRRIHCHKGENRKWIVYQAEAKKDADKQMPGIPETGNFKTVLLEFFFQLLQRSGFKTTPTNWTTEDPLQNPMKRTTN